MKNPSHFIKDIIVTPIAITDPPLLNCVGVHAPYALRIILQVETEGGVVGVSEIPGNKETEEAILKIKDSLIGLDVFQPNKILQKVAEKLPKTEDNRGGTPWDQRIVVHIFSAMEVACLDILGKELNCRVADLLGGTMREQIPFAAYLFYKFKGAGGVWGYDLDPQAEGWAAARQAEAISTEGIIAQAEAMCQEFGYKSIKLKGGFFPPDKEVPDTLAIYKAFDGQMPMRYDPNAIWSLETGIKWAKEFKGKLEYLEDPVRGQENMSKLRREVDIPLATNMCTTSFSDLPGSMKVHSEDIILSDHHFWGGLRSTMELYKICKTFGRGFSMHSNSHLGISLAAMAHIGAALPIFDHEFDTHYPWQSEDVIVGGKIKIEEGCVTLPSGPGLGVEIDPDALEKLHQNYLACGLTKRDDEAEMQKLDPNWKVVNTRY
ncbi:MAG: glucarate dehydratase [Saprospiraceae bacterium]|nr:glucarate dehydratase [Saprospiraceae bacterium]